jgi:hypothetical protein
MLSKLRKQFNERLNPTRSGRWPGILGNASGVVNAGHGFVYVRLLNGQVLKVWNDKVSSIAGLPVLVGYDGKINLLQVLSAWLVYDNPGYQGIKDHHEQHEYPAWDTTWMKLEQIRWLLCLPIGVFEIQIYGGVVLRNGVYTTVDNQNIDIAANVPATGARYVLIQSDNTGVISAKNGAAVGSVELLENTDIPAVDSDCFPLCAVKVYDSQVELQRGTNGVDDFFDLRFSGLVSTGGDIQIDASGFNGNLDPSIDTVQELAQAVNDMPTGGIADAPSDGTPYARQDAGWVAASSGGGGNGFQIDCSGGTSDTYGILAGDIDGANLLFTVSFGSYVSGSLLVYLNGQQLIQGSSEDWEETNPAIGTFTFKAGTTPISGDVITVFYKYATVATGNADTLDGYEANAFVLKSDNGEVEVDFGTGDTIKSKTTVAADVTTASKIVATVICKATANNTADDIMVQPMDVKISNQIAGSFDVTVLSLMGKIVGKVPVSYIAIN